MTKVYKNTPISITELLSHGFESMTFGEAQGDPDQGWFTAGNGARNWGTYQDFSGTNKEGSISLTKSDGTNDWGLFRTITATRQIRLEFYGLFYAPGAGVSSARLALLQVDDGDSTNKSHLYGTDNPSNFISVEIDFDSIGDEYDIGVWYRYNDGSNIKILSVGVDRTIAGGTTTIGVRADITDNKATIYLDTNNNNIFELYGSAAWSSPFSGSPFDKARVDISKISTDEAAIDSIVVSSVVIESGNEITNIKDAISANKLDGEGVASFVYIDHDY